MDVGKVTQLLKTNKLNAYVAQEVDSSGMQVLLKYRKNLFSEQWAVVLESNLEESSGICSTICVTKKIYLQSDSHLP